MDNKYQTIPAKYNGFPVVCDGKSIYLLEGGSLYHFTPEVWKKWVDKNPSVGAKQVYYTTQMLKLLKKINKKLIYYSYKKLSE